MGDKINLILMLLSVVGVAGVVYWWFAASKAGDVRKIDASSQERAKGKAAQLPVEKTAQLSALRERLADAQTATTGLRKMPAKPSEVEKSVEKSWRPEDVGLADSPTVENSSPAARPAAMHSAISDISVPEAKAIVEAPIAIPQLPPVGARLAPAEPAVPSVEARQHAAPIEAPSLPHVDVGIPTVAVEPVERPQSLIHVLLVDDSKVVRMKTEKLLRGHGYSVTTAIDGQDALLKLETLKPTLIITDIEMPKLDGFGLVRNVRANLRTAEIPVIVMTSHVNLHLDIAATEGINGFLPKPFNDQDLLDQVAFLCES